LTRTANWQALCRLRSVESGDSLIYSCNFSGSFRVTGCATFHKKLGAEVGFPVESNVWAGGMRVAFVQQREPKARANGAAAGCSECGAGRNERPDTMAKDDRDILELLKEELAFIEQGGYGRSVRTPWLPKSAFQDSLTCINYADPTHTHPCDECHLIDFVDRDKRDEQVPCHYIPLNEAGETIEDLEARDNQGHLESTLKLWMRAKIKEIEEARATAKVS